MKQKNEIIALVVLMALAALVLGWQFWPSSASKAASAALFQPYKPLNFTNPEIQWPIIESRRKAEYKPSGVNLFSMNVPPSQEEIKTQKDHQTQTPTKQHTVACQQSPSPPQVPADMKLFWYATPRNG